MCSRWSYAYRVSAQSALQRSGVDTVGINDDFRAWMAEAYRVGEQQHLTAERLDHRPDLLVK
jgi:hypothetical protein